MKSLQDCLKEYLVNLCEGVEDKYHHKIMLAYFQGWDDSARKSVCSIESSLDEFHEVFEDVYNEGEE